MTGSGLKTVERALQLLTLFVRSPDRTWSLAELAQETGYHKTTVLRMLATLEQYKVLARDSETRRYRLGTLALELGAAAGAEFRRVAYPEMVKLSAETGETALLHVVSGVETVCIEKVESHQPVRVTFDIGRRGPLYAGASGKSLLAFLEPDRINEILAQVPLRQYTPATITDPDELRRELERTRARGYAISHGELDAGIWSVGAPIWNSLGRLEGGLALVGLESRWTEDRWPLFVRATRAAAQRISQALGYRNLDDSLGTTVSNAAGDS